MRRGGGQEEGKVRARAAARSHPFRTSDLPGTHRMPPFASVATREYLVRQACLRSTFAVGSSVRTADKRTRCSSTLYVKTERQQWERNGPAGNEFLHLLLIVARQRTAAKWADKGSPPGLYRPHTPGRLYRVVNSRRV